MMDQFAEQLVKKQPTTQDDMKRALLLVAAIVLSLGFLCLAFVMPLAIVLPVGIICLTIYLLRLQKVEYEYSCTNGILDIDKILGQTKRVTMLSVDVKTFTAYGKYSTCQESGAELTTFSAVGRSMMGENDGADEYYAEFMHPEHGACCLLFTPNANLREALEPFLSRSIRASL